MIDLTDTEREQIATILERRANEIASFNAKVSGRPHHETEKE